MASTFSPRTGLEKHANGDTTWGTGMRANLDSLDSAVAPDRVFFVSPRFNTGDMPALANATDRRHFDTIQGAIAAGEAKLYSLEGYLLLVSPGIYNENLVITRSVRIAPAAGGMPGFYPAGAVAIRGVNTVEAPVIKIDPLENDSQRFEFLGLSIDNAYDQVEAGEIPTAYAVDVLAQTTTGGIQNVVSFQNCHFRMQTWGVTHKWTVGLQFAGFNAVTLDQCQIQGLDFGGGSGAAGVRYLMGIGGHSVGKNCDLRFQRSRLANVFSGGGSHYAFAQSGNSQVLVSEAFLSYASQAAALLAGGANNTNFGLASGELATYRNTLGLDLVRML